jgi:hypothetical protein
MSGAACKTFHHEVQQPRQADAHRAANPAQGEALSSNEKVVGACAKLALAIFTQMVLFAMASVAIFLVPG